MPEPDSGSACALKHSGLLEIAKMLWFASVCCTAPEVARSVLSDGLHAYIPMGDIDPGMLDLYEEDLEWLVDTISTTRWKDALDKAFSRVGRSLLTLRPANYLKHILGSTDEQRRANSMRGDSQLRIKFDASYQTKICEYLLWSDLDDAIRQRAGDSSPLEFTCSHPAEFLEFVDGYFDRDSRLIAGCMDDIIGFDRGSDVATFYLDVARGAKEFHMYPSLMRTEEEAKAIYLKVSHMEPTDCAL
ncbi:hypothetical protein [Dyella sp. AtDHG13]|uniref:hypothetical protein n=1 Tax=Dyella sp. AtDHG13 TaxID=1938897 RepID=UPI001F3FE962|nr:hypothetical protein [Dyella sp. AtDHG13]